MNDELLALVMREYNYAKGISADFTRQGMSDSAEMWDLVATRFRRVLDDYGDQITNKMNAKVKA
jgi:hypothetical protein